MTHIAFRRFCALVLALVYSFVFICCSPLEETTLTKPPTLGKSSTSTSKVYSTSSIKGYGVTGDWATPPGLSTTTIIIMVVAGIAIVIGIVVLLNKSSQKESAVKLDGLDSVLTTPSSLKLGGTRVPVADSLSSFSVTVDVENAKTIIDGNVSVAFEQGGWRSILSFGNVLGVADDRGGPYVATSTAVKTGDVIYLKVNEKTVYRVRVKEEARGNVTLEFERL